MAIKWNKTPAVPEIPEWPYSKFHTPQWLLKTSQSTYVYNREKIASLTIYLVEVGSTPFWDAVIPSPAPTRKTRNRPPICNNKIMKNFYKK